MKKEIIERNIEDLRKNEIKFEDIFFVNNINESEMEIIENKKKPYLKTIVQYFSENLFEKSLISCKTNYELSKELFRMKFNPELKNFPALLNYLADGLLYIRALIKSDKIDNAREFLLKFLNVFLKYFNENDVIPLEAKNLDSIKKKAILKKYTNFIATFASLFSAIGDFKNSEILYIKYIKIIEINLGNMTVDASNCYFLIALFYYHQVNNAKKQSSYF